MKIKSIRIENFRAFKDETISFNGYTCLVGPNGAGKSTVLYALNLFFGATGESSVDLASLEEEDFFQRDTSAPITVTVTFCDLEPEAQRDFTAYYRQNELVISACATFNAESKRADVQQFGQRMRHCFASIAHCGRMPVSPDLPCFPSAVAQFCRFSGPGGGEGSIGGEVALR